MDMAKRSSKNSKSKPMTPKAGYTRSNSKRRYDCGGKLKTK